MSTPEDPQDNLTRFERMSEAEMLAHLDKGTQLLAEFIYRSRRDPRIGYNLLQDYSLFPLIRLDLIDAMSVVMDLGQSDRVLEYKKHAGRTVELLYGDRSVTQIWPLASGGFRASIWDKALIRKTPEEWEGIAAMLGNPPYENDPGMSLDVVFLPEEVMDGNLERLVHQMYDHESGTSLKRRVLQRGARKEAYMFEAIAADRDGQVLDPTLSGEFRSLQLEWPSERGKRFFGEHHIWHSHTPFHRAYATESEGEYRPFVRVGENRYGMRVAAGPENTTRGIVNVDYEIYKPGPIGA